MFNLKLAFIFSKRFFKNLIIGSSLLIISYFVFQTGIANAVKKNPNPVSANHRIIVSNDNSSSNRSSSSSSSSSSADVFNNTRIFNDNFQRQTQTVTVPVVTFAPSTQFISATMPSQPVIITQPTQIVPCFCTIQTLTWDAMPTWSTWSPTWSTWTTWDNSVW